MRAFETIIDANQNRAKEGIRVLEEIARFLLKHEALFRKLKALRHQIKIDSISRSSSEDLGGPAFTEGSSRKDLIEILQANALRAQEALRVLEETTQQRAFYKRLRFEAYTLHQEIYDKVRSFLKKDLLKGIYAIYDPEQVDLDFEKVLHKILVSKIDLLQLRIKKGSKKEIFKIASDFRKSISNKPLLIINDHFDVALSCANGVHLGESDFPVEEARRLSPHGFIIGATVHNMDEAIQAQKNGADYVSVGCLFPTASKKNAISTSLEDLKKIKNRLNVPVCAIGGIDKKNLDLIQKQNVDMVAMLSNFWN